MKKYFVLFLSLAILTFTLLSCSGGGGEGGADCTHADKDDDCVCDGCGATFTDGCDTRRDLDDNGRCDNCLDLFEDGKDLPDPAGVIYSPTVFPAVVYNYESEKAVKDATALLRDHMRDNAGVSPSLFTDTGAVFPHEIVIGDTSRDISAVAKEILNEKLLLKRAELLLDGEDDEFLSGYLIYSDGASVAVVWTDFQLAEKALDSFSHSYLSEDTLILEEGFTSSKFLFLDEYQVVC